MAAAGLALGRSASRRIWCRSCRAIRCAADAGRRPGRPVSAAPFGSALILPISYAYIRMMGAAGLKRATEVAILNANYIAARLNEHYPVLYRGANGMVAHECIIDCRGFQAEAGVMVEDIAKRLQDFGYPRADHVLAGRGHADDRADGKRMQGRARSVLRRDDRDPRRDRRDRRRPLDKADNPLKHAPHTAREVTANVWTHAYSREQAAFPLPFVAAAKYWPPVKRVDNVYGDRNLVCTCAPLEAYAEAAE